MLAVLDRVAIFQGEESSVSSIILMNSLKQVHGYSIRNDVYHTKTLMLEFLRVGDISYARQLFDGIPKPSVFLYNRLIQAYSSQGLYKKCLALYHEMCIHGHMPNQHSFTFLFSACTSLLHVQVLHSHLAKSGFGYDVFCLTSLIDMYAKLGQLSHARRQFDAMPVRDVATWNSMIAGYARTGQIHETECLFEAMPLRNVVSWTTMISGYTQNGQSENALSLFCRMENETHLCPNEFTVSSALSACANTGGLSMGERLHSYAASKGFLGNMFVCNALIEMFAKCGKIDKARQMFEAIAKSRNVCTWNSMIVGLAVHGEHTEALDLFFRMKREGINPDHVTLVGALLACVHGGLVAEGQEIFSSMEVYHSVSPKIQHYSCMVDLLGRSGRLAEAYKVVLEMPMKPDNVVWGALLGACCSHGNTELAEVAAKALFDLDPGNLGNYVILSNVCASVGQWDRVAELRKMMKEIPVNKEAGYSLIEMEGTVHKFTVEDRSHVRAHEMYELLEIISEKMKDSEENLCVT